MRWRFLRMRSGQILRPVPLSHSKRQRMRIWKCRYVLWNDFDHFQTSENNGICVQKGRWDLDNVEALVRRTSLVETTL